MPSARMKTMKMPSFRKYGRTAAWKPVMLTKLFEGQNKRPSQQLPVEIDAESDLMEALANINEDEHPDDGAVEIPSEDESVT